MSVAVKSVEVRAGELTSSLGPTGWNHTQVYRVWLTGRSITGAAMACTASGIPTYGSAFPLNDGTVVSAVSARLVDNSATAYDVTVNYIPDEELKIQRQMRKQTPYDTPLQEPPQVSFDHAVVTMLMAKDVNDKVVCDSAGMSFSRGLERSIYLPMAVIRRNLNANSYNIASAKSIIGTIPADAVTVCGVSVPKEKAVLTKWSASLQYYNHPQTGKPVSYYAHEINILFDDNAKNIEILDEGFYYLESGVRKLIMVNGQPAVTPQMLNGFGAVQAQGGMPVYITFQKLLAASWNAIQD